MRQSNEETRIDERSSIERTTIIQRSAIGLHSPLPMAGKKKTGGRNADNAGVSDQLR
jgi:hypothetical protein